MSFSFAVHFKSDHMPQCIGKLCVLAKIYRILPYLGHYDSLLWVPSDLGQGLVSALLLVANLRNMLSVYGSQSFMSTE